MYALKSHLKNEKKNWKGTIKKSRHNFKKIYKPQTISIQRERYLGAKLL